MEYFFIFTIRLPWKTSKRLVMAKQRKQPKSILPPTCLKLWESTWMNFEKSKVLLAR